jgi:primosomal protein N'
MGRKRTEIIIETERVILIRNRSDNSTLRCDRCGESAYIHTTDESYQEPERCDEQVRDSAQGRSVVCHRCDKRKARS